MSGKIDRRSFLMRLAGTGALIATSQLPSLADDDPSKFSLRGNYERVVLNYVTINIGLKQPFSILHISDTHFTSVYPHEDDELILLGKKRMTTFGGRQEEALRDTLSWAREHVEYVLHTGDLIDFQSEANFDLVKKHFGDSFFGCIGNHEFTIGRTFAQRKSNKDESYKDLSRSVLENVFSSDISFRSQIVHDVNFITMDDVFGYVTERQVQLFKQETKKGLPIVLCMHVPFHTDNTWRASKRFWDSESPMRDSVVPKAYGDYLMQEKHPITRDFIAYLKQEKLLKAILCGHEHITVQDKFSDTANIYIVGANFMFHGQEVMFL